MLLMAFALGGNVIWAQITNFYSFSESSGAYTSLVGANISTATGDDGEQTNVPIGFTFEFNQVQYTTLTIGTNGAVSFTQTDIGYSNAMAGSSGKNFLTPLWDDLYARTGDSVKIMYLTEGSAPNRTFTIEWKNISWRNAGDTVNFQIVLEETSNKIYFKYGANYSDDASMSASIGIIDNVGGSGHFISVLPGVTATASSTVATDTLDFNTYPGNGKVYVFTYTPPSCYSPSNLVLDSVSTVAGYISWQIQGSSANYRIEYGATGFTQGTGSLMTVSTNNATITGLNSATSYSAYVKSLCTSNDSSPWVGPINFTTECNAFTATTTMNFEGLTTPNLPVCFSKIINSSNSYATLGSSSSSTHGGTRSLSFYNSGDASAKLYFVSPEFSDLTTQANQIRFWVNGGSSSNKMIVGVMSDPLVESTFTPLDTFNLTTSYAEITYKFDAYSGSSKYIAILPLYGTTYSNIYVDDIIYEPIPACSPVISVAASSITATSASISWTEVGTATQWDIQYGVSGFTLGSGTIVNVTTNPYAITLNPATSYSVYVRAKCSANDTSSWTGPANFTTLCQPVTTLPWTEGFESMTNTGSGVIPTCWLESGDWATGSGADSYNRGPKSGSKYIYTNWTADDYLYSPEFTLTSGTSYDFSFYYNTDGYTGWTKTEVFLATSQSSSSIVDTIGTEISNAINTTYQKWTGSFVPSTTGSYYVIVHVVANGNPWYFMFDDFKLETTPSCLSPVSLTSSSITTNSAIISWTEAGTASTWDVEYGLSGFTPGTGTMITGATNPDTLTGLLASNAYDFYVRANCGGGFLSPFEGPSTFTTLCNPVNVFPYTESFEGSFPNSCWSIVDVTGTAGNWLQNTGTSSPSGGGSVEGTKVAYFNSYDVNSGNDTRLVTPEFDITGLSNPMMSFWMYHEPGYSSSLDYLVVQADLGSGWISIDTIQRYSTNAGWMNHKYTMAAASDTMKIGFLGVSQYGNDIHIDAFYAGENVSLNLGQDTSICAGETLTLLASSDTTFTYSWTISGNSQVLSDSAQILIDTAATYVCTMANGYISVSDTIIVGIYAPIYASVSGFNPEYCSNEVAVTLTGSPSGGTFTGAGISGNDFNPANASIGSNAVTYTVVSSNGCSSDTTIIITVNQVPSVSFTGLNANYCVNESASTLVGSPVGGVFTGTGVSNGSFDPTTLTTGIYTVSYSYIDSNNCSSSATASANVYELPIITISNDTSICEGSSVNLTASSNGLAGGVFFSSYIEGSSNNKAIEVFNATADTISLDNYRISQSTNGGGWNYYHNFTAGAKLAPNKSWVIVTTQTVSTLYDTSLADQVMAYPSVVHHNGDDARGLEYTNNGGTSWTLIDVIGVPTNDPGVGWAVAGVADATANHTMIRKPNIISGNTDWTAIAGTDSLSSEYLVYPIDYFSELGMHSVSATGSVTYLWNSGDNQGTITVNPTNNTIYSVEVSNGHCSSFDSVEVTVNSLPVVSLSGPDTLCNTTSVTLDAGIGFASYLWSNSTTTQTSVFDSTNLVIGNNTVWVSVSDANGCSNSDTITIYMDDCTSIFDPETGISLSIYPNPNEGEFSIDIQGLTGKANVQIFSIEGKIVYSEDIQINESHLSKYNLTSVAPGFYQIKLTHDNKVVTQKIIIK